MRAFRQEAVGAAISSSVKEALDEQNLFPLTEPELGEVDSEGDGPLSFKVTIEVKPSFEPAEYKGIELTRLKKEVTDEDVERARSSLDALSRRRSPRTPSETHAG